MTYTVKKKKANRMRLFALLVLAMLAGELSMHKDGSIGEQTTSHVHCVAERCNEVGATIP
jgi:hypothetical protein